MTQQRRSNRAARNGIAIAFGGSVLAFALGGCSAGSTGTGSTGWPAGSAAAASTGSVPVAGATTSPGSAGSAGAGPGPATVTATVVRTEARFETPSKNIACVLVDNTVRCDIKVRDWNVPPDPNSTPCDQASDHTSAVGLVIVYSGTVEFECAGDSPLDDPTRSAVSYGQAIRSGNLECDVLPTGVRCYNLVARHGFSIAKESYARF